MPASWDAADNLNAEALGWGLFNTGGDGSVRLEIQRIDDPEGGYAPIFDGDGSTLEYVTRRADEGSDLHARALALHQHYAALSPSSPAGEEGK